MSISAKSWSMSRAPTGIISELMSRLCTGYFIQCKFVTAPNRICPVGGDFRTHDFALFAREVAVRRCRVPRRLPFSPFFGSVLGSEYVSAAVSRRSARGGSFDSARYRSLRSVLTCGPSDSGAPLEMAREPCPPAPLGMAWGHPTRPHRSGWHMAAWFSST